MAKLKFGATGALVLSVVVGLTLSGCSSGQQAPQAAASDPVVDTNTSGGSVDTSASGGSVDTSASAGSVDASTSSAGAETSPAGPAAGSGQASEPSSASAPAGSGGVAKGPLTIAEIDKQGNQQYFVDQATGAKGAGKKAGDVTVNVTDVQLDSNAAINAINTAVAQGANGIIITVPDQKIGPQVIQAAKQANIPLIATNDPIKDGAGVAAPFVGFNSTKMGEEVGKKAGELYVQAGWKAADTRVINVQKQDLNDCVERGKGALEAFSKVVGSDLPKVLDLSTDAATPQALDRTGALITANPGVNNWVVWGCNDESETGSVSALQNAGFGADTVIGVGLGAYLTCKDWKAGAKTGNKAALYISGKTVGETAVDLMIDHLRNGTPLPPETLAPTAIVDATNWKQAGVVCT